MKQITCLQCGQSIAHKRSDAKYCSDRCRMQYRRNQKTEQLLAELIQLCSQIPNHTEQSTGEVVRIIIRNEKTGTYETIDVEMLKKLPDKELKHMIERKKQEVKAHHIANFADEWINR